MIANQFEKDRHDRLVKLTELGINPYGSTILADLKAKSLSLPEEIANVLHSYNRKEESGSTEDISKATIAGRVMLFRDNGGLIWMQVRDQYATMQAAISKKNISPTEFAAAKTMEIGDLVVVSGPVKKTQTGEITVWAEYFGVAAKSLAHPPDKHCGLTDIETRYRQRYIDMAFNEEFRKNLFDRANIISLVRRFFDMKEYIEVETPMLHPIAGGAAARPFATTLNALDIPLFLRVAPELYLKKLLVGGMRNIYEINRNFRNEGIDATHNPEFTALEAYSIFNDMNGMIELARRLLANLVIWFVPEGKLQYKDIEINLNNVHYVSYNDLYFKVRGKNFWEESSIEEANRIFESECEGLLDKTAVTFVIGYPSAISPLTKKDSDNPHISQRADLFIAGMEIGTFYTEQNDPEEQMKVFSSQVADEEENTHRTMDLDFIEALKVGMPPTGGLGIGIDRLVMLLTNSSSIRDVIPFPFMKPIKELEHA